MNPIRSTIQLLSKLWKNSRNRRKKQFSGLVVLMILSSFLEIISIGAILPFLTALTNPDRILGSPMVMSILGSIGFAGSVQMLGPLTAIFCVAALLAGTMRLVLLWAYTKFAQGVGADISIDIYRRTLHQPYVVHIARNSSEIISGILNKAGGVATSIMAILNLISSVAIMFVIFFAVLAMEPLIATVVFGGFGFLYILIIALTRKKLHANSELIARESTQVIKYLQEGLGGIREVLLDGSQESYCQLYSSADIPVRRATAAITFLSGSPRYVMESMGMLLLALLASTMARGSGGFLAAIPVIGALALGAQRLLPALQQVYVSWTAIQAGLVSMQDTIHLLEQPVDNGGSGHPSERIKFKKSITANNISFKYSSNASWVIENINLTVNRGSRTGIIGETASGKSTLINIIMALLSPEKGALEIDGVEITAKNRKAWQSHIAHVPQAIFLADSSIEENIAFGVPAILIDRNRVKEAARQALMDSAIMSWPQGYKTKVGERGVRLSGGQRQRIGIARALYKQADVIILDEATSALDYETENSVMEAIEALSAEITIIIIAHRLSTLRNCDQIVEIFQGGVRQSGSYKQVMINKVQAHQ